MTITNGCSLRNGFQVVVVYRTLWGGFPPISKSKGMVGTPSSPSAGVLVVFIPLSLSLPIYLYISLSLYIYIYIICMY